MGRLERKLLRIVDRQAALRESERLVAEELSIHRHLDDDARRDAAVSESPLDRADARETAADVRRFEDHLARLQAEQQRLEARRRKLVARLRD
ncbi:MAG TPA: hypothetical protein VGC47_01115 [Acidimicrobiia bacterium]